MVVIKTNEPGTNSHPLYYKQRNGGPNRVEIRNPGQQEFMLHKMLLNETLILRIIISTNNLL
jgi:hypothetical protein